MIVFSKWLNLYIWPIDGTLIGSTTPNQSGPKSNGNEGVLCSPQTVGLKPHHQIQFSVRIGYLFISTC